MNLMLNRLHRSVKRNKLIISTVSTIRFVSVNIVSMWYEAFISVFSLAFSFLKWCLISLVMNTLIRLKHALNASVYSASRTYFNIAMYGVFQTFTTEIIKDRNVLIKYVQGRFQDFTLEGA